METEGGEVERWDRAPAFRKLHRLVTSRNASSARDRCSCCYYSNTEPFFFFDYYG